MMPSLDFPPHGTNPRGTRLLLIALAYFSIPLELIYFVTCSAIFSFRWLIFQFGALIVLCGLTHLVATLTYAPHSFILLLALIVLKLLTALVSLATAVALVTLIPQLLHLFVRDDLLCQKARDLNRNLGCMRHQESAVWHIRLLTAEIRRSIDRHAILDTTLVQLADTPTARSPSPFRGRPNHARDSMEERRRHWVSIPIFIEREREREQRGSRGCCGEGRQRIRERREEKSFHLAKPRAMLTQSSSMCVLLHTTARSLSPFVDDQTMQRGSRGCRGEGRRQLRERRREEK